MWDEKSQKYLSIYYLLGLTIDLEHDILFMKPLQRCPQKLYDSKMWIKMYSLCCDLTINLNQYQSHLFLTNDWIIVWNFNSILNKSLLTVYTYNLMNVEGWVSKINRFQSQTSCDCDHCNNWSMVRWSMRDRGSMTVHGTHMTPSSSLMTKGNETG